ncbi:fungal transcriptional regulatory protein [Ophiostoma piceae UAMH 11346]|uniref:Fungal transcriptional regulatory protein n=1 Tax=Ophiostoma piceae (strain UAMH 11346) TaxID=1262450 RepID=S3BSR0_OPHP1|nr:fungal transcriptional regulatory protein [Ophiostoma piceae UAMH 11346]
MAAHELQEGGDPLTGQPGQHAKSIAGPGVIAISQASTAASTVTATTSPSCSQTQTHAARRESAPTSRDNHVGAHDVERSKNGTNELQEASDKSSPSPDSNSTGDTPNLKRKASPPTMSANAARAAKMTRIRKACDICRMRKVKCDGVSPCKPCQALGAQCTFRYISRHRGPVSRFAGGGWPNSDAPTETASTPTTSTPPAAVATAAATRDNVHTSNPVNMAINSPGLSFNQIFAPVYIPQPMTLPQPPLPEALAQLPQHTIGHAIDTIDAIDAIDTMDHAISNSINQSMDIHTDQSYHQMPAAPPAISYSTSYFDINGQPQINIYPRMPRPPEAQVTHPVHPSSHPVPPPPPPPSATDAIAPFHVLELLVDDFYTYIHPLIPFPHEPTFRRRFTDPQERQTPRFLSLLASMIGCLAASFPRSVRPHLRARHNLGKQNSQNSQNPTSSSGKFARAICMVECCRDVALNARGATFYVKPMLSVDDAATSYFLGLAAGYTFDWRLCRRFMAEAMSFVQELGFHRPASQVASAANSMASATIGVTTAAAAGLGAGVGTSAGGLSTLYSAHPPFNHVDDQIGKRIFWILYLAMRSLIQLGATLSETPLPPYNNARPYPDLPAEVDDAYIEPDVIHAQPAGTISLITGFNKTIQVYATMDPIATMDYACGLNQVPAAAQRVMFVEALKAAKVITDTLPDELYLPLPGSEDGTNADPENMPNVNEMTANDANGNGSASSDTSTPIEVFYDELSGYRYYPPAEDGAGRTSPALRRSSSVSSQMNPISYTLYPGAASTSAPRPDDLRLLLKTDPARRRQVQYDIQKTNIYASQLATRSYFVEMYLHLNETTKGRGDEAEIESGESPMAGERERIVHSLLFVLAAIPQYNMEPNGSALINKIRQVASTIIGATPISADGTANSTQTSPMEDQLIRFLEILIRLEKTGGPGRPSTSAASTVSSEEDIDEEEELQNWANLREEQIRFAASGGYLTHYS